MVNVCLTKQANLSIAEIALAVNPMILTILDLNAIIVGQIVLLVQDNIIELKSMGYGET